MKTQSLARIAVFAAVLFIQEQLLTVIPNVQFTQLLIVLYFYLFGYWETSAIIFVHVLLDNLMMGSWSFYYTPTMLVGWLTLPFILQIGFNRSKNSLWIAVGTAIHSFIYSWFFLGASVLMWEMNPITYFFADIEFELILALNGFLTVWLLLPPLRKVLEKIRQNDKFIL